MGEHTYVYLGERTEDFIERCCKMIVAGGAWAMNEGLTITEAANKANQLWAILTPPRRPSP